MVYLECQVAPGVVAQYRQSQEEPEIGHKVINSQFK